MTKQKVKLPNGKVVRTEDAGGVKGVLLRSAVDNMWFFRRYDGSGGFADYELRSEELFVTIDADTHAAFYSDGETEYLDFSPALLAYDVLDEDE